ncbi:hypothetical protein HMPREF1545_04084 [Oscillibacter sp. KLE 1728]|nr:hypothetical protein HMPREF1545_04084 [Oscillibacter sp. KLE 1728]ERK59130.1 hypothetical protein HMPREF1546_03501 [Oscillibacter sp. KLE 1745]
MRRRTPGHGRPPPHAERKEMKNEKREGGSVILFGGCLYHTPKI